MYSVTKIITFCYGHRLLHYEGKCRDLHGHNGRAEIELVAERLDGRGMVRDFTEIKRAIQGWIDAELDHKMILNAKDPALPLLRSLREPLYVIADNPTAETLARLIYDQAKRLGFPVRSVRLWETDSSFAVYQPAEARAGRRARRRTAARSISTAA
ncbi:MAG: 6-carboxytetrahydropterin synthase [Candidatus Omnitrophica bacterium]|nr:6-carboxytetrahydropterin synthase [Candidatus Omnitrophota bacterium]